MVALLTLSSAIAQEPLWKGTFDGWDFGFKNHIGERDEFWEIQSNGELYAIGGDDYNGQSGMRTAKIYGDYELTLEYKWITAENGDLEGNSGIWIHGENNFAQDNGGFPNSIEVQLKKGEAGDLLRKGVDITSESDFPNKGKDEKNKVREEQLPRRKLPNIIEHMDKEWNKMTIRCEGDMVTVYLNHLLINKGNVHKNGNAITSGFITFQSELKNLSFKDIFIKQLPNCRIEPYVSVNSGGLESGDIAEIAIGDAVTFAPESAELGSEGRTWSWTGPNNFSAQGRELNITNIKENQFGVYRVTNTDQSGCTDTHAFEIGPETELVAGTYYLKNIQTGLYLDADSDGVIKQGSELIDDDTHWNLITSSAGYFFIDNGMDDRGPLAASSALNTNVSYESESALNTPDPKSEWKAIKVRNNIYRFLSKDEARGYLTVVGNKDVKNTNDATSKASEWELISTTGEPIALPICSIDPYVNVNSGGLEAGDIAEIAIGEAVTFAPKSIEFDTEGGTWSWSGPNNFNHNGRELNITNIKNDQLGTYTVTNLDQNGCTATHAFELSVETELVAGTYY